MRAFSIRQIEAWSAHRPAGYVARVLAAADRIEGGRVYLSERAWWSLSAQPKRGFGDWLAALLDPIVGGFMGPTCGCAGRRELLNRFDSGVRRWIRAATARLQRALRYEKPF